MKKQLGQHWLKDRQILQNIVSFAEIDSNDNVLEIGPGLGTLTSALLHDAKSVTAIEIDSDLARKLPQQFPNKNLTVLNTDVLNFDERTLKTQYKIVANLPYYITAKIINKFLYSDFPPQSMTILIQEEVAQRIIAKAGDMSILAVAVQLTADAELGQLVLPEFFTPPPKVNSRVLRLKLKPISLPNELNKEQFFTVVKAGFSEKRKKLKSSLSGGLRLPKQQVISLIENTNIDSNLRAEQLSISDWKRLALAFNQQAKPRSGFNPDL